VDGFFFFVLFLKVTGATSFFFAVHSVKQIFPFSFAVTSGGDRVRLGRCDFSTVFLFFLLLAYVLREKRIPCPTSISLIPLTGPSSLFATHAAVASSPFFETFDVYCPWPLPGLACLFPKRSAPPPPLFFLVTPRGNGSSRLPNFCIKAGIYRSIPFRTISCPPASSHDSRNVCRSQRL